LLGVDAGVSGAGESMFGLLIDLIMEICALEKSRKVDGESIESN
jgi:hypothetical protein